MVNKYRNPLSVLIVIPLLLFLQCSRSKTPYQPVDDLKNNTIKIIQDLGSVSLDLDQVFLMEVKIIDDSLILKVSYAGGCKDHNFKLYGLSGFAKSNPPQAYIYLSHNGNNDLCEALITEWLSFDLLPLKVRYNEVFNDGGPLLLRIYPPGISDPYQPLPLYEF